MYIYVYVDVDVDVDVYVYIYVYVYVYIYTYMCVCMYLCIYVYISAYICIYMYVYIYIHMYIYACTYTCILMYVDRSPSLSLSLFACPSIHPSVFFVSACLRIFVCLCPPVSVPGRLFVRSSVCQSGSVSFCVSVSLSVCRSQWQKCPKPDSWPEPDNTCLFRMQSAALAKRNTSASDAYVP